MDPRGNDRSTAFFFILVCAVAATPALAWLLLLGWPPPACTDTAGNLFCSLSVTDSADKSSRVSVPPTPPTRLRLAGWFAWDTPPERVQEWSQLWSRVLPLKDILVFVPTFNAEGSDFPFTTNTSHGPVVVQYDRPADVDHPHFWGTRRGPVQFLAQAIRLSVSGDGGWTDLLFVADDVIVSPKHMSLLKQKGNKAWFRLWTDEQASKRVDTHCDHGWHWKATCQVEMNSSSHDPRMKDCWGRGDGESFPWLGIRYGSDYLKIHLLDQDVLYVLLCLLDIFAEHDSFLECAIPTAIEMALSGSSKPLSVRSASLCTSRTELRRKPETWPCVKKNPDVLHPIKGEKWSQWFNETFPKLQD